MTVGYLITARLKSTRLEKKIVREIAGRPILAHMLDLLAALLPCAWGYVYIARHLADGEAHTDERYADWIAQYASDEFREAADWLENELNRLAVGVTTEKMTRLTELFVLSSRYEWQFWEMCWTGEEWRP